jgi:hypothetical protein
MRFAGYFIDSESGSGAFVFAKCCQRRPGVISTEPKSRTQHDAVDLFDLL